MATKIFDPLRGGFYIIHPLNPKKLEMIFAKFNITLESLLEGTIDLELLEKFQNEVIAESLLNWSLPDVEQNFPSDMKEPITQAILSISNGTIQRKEVS